MQVEAGVLHLEHKGIEVEVSIVWDLVQGGPIYALKDGKIFMSLTTEEIGRAHV